VVAVDRDATGDHAHEHPVTASVALGDVGWVGMGQVLGDVLGCALGIAAVATVLRLIPGLAASTGDDPSAPPS
jgi:hypothetical protein